MMKLETGYWTELKYRRWCEAQRKYTCGHYCHFCRSIPMSCCVTEAVVRFACFDVVSGSCRFFLDFEEGFFLVSLAIRQLLLPSSVTRKLTRGRCQLLTRSLVYVQRIVSRSSQTALYLLSTPTSVFPGSPAHNYCMLFFSCSDGQQSSYQFEQRITIV